MLDTGGANPMLKRRSLFERCVTLPVGATSVARKQSIRSVGGHVHNLTTSYFEGKETKFVGNKTAIYICNRSSLYLLFVKLASLRVSSSFISDRSDMQEQARSMSSTQAVVPSPSHNRDGSEKVRTFDKRTLPPQTL